MTKRYIKFEKDLIKKKEKLKINHEEIKERIVQIQDSVAAFEKEILEQVDPTTNKVTVDKFLK